MLFSVNICRGAKGLLSLIREICKSEKFPLDKLNLSAYNNFQLIFGGSLMNDRCSVKANSLFNEVFFTSFFGFFFFTRPVVHR
jgi:hypothetical protein